MDTFAHLGAPVTSWSAGCQRGSVVEAQAAEAGQLQRGMAQVEPGHKSHEIDLDALDPGELHAQQSPERGLDAGAAVGQAEIEAGAKVLANRIRRQGGRELRDRAQHRRGEGIAVRSGPDAVVAVMIVAIGRDRGLDLRDQRGGLVCAHVDEDARRVAIPAPIRCPSVAAHRCSPADHVVTLPGRRIRALEHHPAVNGKDSLPASGAASEDEQPRVAIGARRRQHSDARPIGVAIAGRPLLARIERSMDGDGQQEQRGDSEEHFSKWAAHGGLKRRVRRRIWAHREPPATLVRHTGTRKTSAVAKSGRNCAEACCQRSRWKRPTSRRHARCSTAHL